ncbi:uncharacterized protein PHACADRAFT_262373 [Phanerochaete carnosa HHB-10118-sp]|uniref:Uncharacterized protein n=1 Tax=Phanerochaete carnosa (strain HHB-10118-sp) TaxID=650164 RepID=K5WNQ1_PHACS|nr:uncharacterized protein PHACADRAFT_262373 [Phanerochaete carnosa HHB-10118-sp]EKM51947.1 hypothetical protein PHACADRAFT_262373 [Phanerochaete carnosa HHB-10118-sp]
MKLRCGLSATYVAHLSTYGSIVLLGDLICSALFDRLCAAYVMSSHFTAGAGQVIEDAYAAGRLLFHTAAYAPSSSRSTPASRWQVATDAVEQSPRLGGIFELQLVRLPEGADSEKLCAGDEWKLKDLKEPAQVCIQFTRRRCQSAIESGRSRY